MVYLKPFGIFIANLWPIGKFCGHLVYCSTLGYVVPGAIWQPCYIFTLLIPRQKYFVCKCPGVVVYVVVHIWNIRAGVRIPPFCKVICRNSYIAMPVFVTLIELFLFL
jgi:hypothetical protein